MATSPSEGNTRMKRLFLLSSFTLLLVHVADPLTGSGRASEIEIPCCRSSQSSLMSSHMSRTPSKNARTIGGENEPTVSVPSTVESGPAVTQEQHLDSSKIEKSPAWQPGDPVKIMRDLKKNRKPTGDQR
jgi:hypothetical protein